MDIGLPPASPSDKDIDLKVHWYLTSILFKKSQNDNSDTQVHVVPDEGK